MEKSVKRYVIVIILLAIIGTCIGVFIYTKSSRPVWITDHEFLYDKAIEYLDKKHTAESYDKNKEGFKIFFDYEPFGIEEKGKKRIVYMWVLEEEYYLENNHIESGSGSSMPCKFIFENNEVVSYQIPSDGSEYGPSIKKMFPKSIVNKIYSFNLDSTKLIKLVEEYYGQTIIW